MTSERGGLRRWARHAPALAVLLIGLAVAAALTALSAAAYNRNEQRLLAVQGGLTAATLEAEPLYVQAHLAAAADLAAGTADPAAAFHRALAGTVGTKGPFVAASLWRVGSGGSRLIGVMGGKPLLRPSSETTRRFVASATGSTFVVKRLTAPGQVRLAYAVAAGGTTDIVVYAEEPIPANARISEPRDSPIHNLNLALYLGPSVRRGILLETDSAAPLPLTGRTSTHEIPFGNAKLTLVVSPRGSLSGSLSEDAPWGIGALIVLLSVAGAWLAERLARRRDQAERSARASAQIARTLQHSLLPEALPPSAGFLFAVRYVAGAAGAEVGGDWYDIVRIDEHHLFFSVGDVCGRGLRAAALMGTLRNAINAYAHEGYGPDAVLGLLARLVDVRDGRFATVLCGRIDTRTGEIALANAGHIPPLLIGVPGAEFIPVPLGPPVGVQSVSYAATSFVLGPSQILFACTDGLVERRGEVLSDGLERLRRAGLPGRALDQLLDEMFTSLGADEAVDDVAMLAIERVAEAGEQPDGTSVSAREAGSSPERHAAAPNEGTRPAELGR